MRKLASWLVLLGWLSVLSLTACGDTTGSQPTTTVSPQATVGQVSNLKAEVRPLLNQLWQSYKDRYTQPDGRVRDPQRNTDPTTSEGQSYGLLRAVWQDDRPTFEAILNWSITNLQTPRGDKLFSYLWGKHSDNTWKVLDTHAASDADQDIAFALLLASHQWNEPRYEGLAVEILNDIWAKLVVTVKGRPYLTAGDWSVGLAQPVLNPSYFAPYEYRLFSQRDPDKTHQWAALIDTSYEAVLGCTAARLDAEGAGKLPPNWCTIDKNSTQFGSALGQDKTFDSNFGYDAFRTVWRLALDYRWYSEKRAGDYLQSLTGLREEWGKTQKLASVHDHLGRPSNPSEDLGVLAGAGLPLLSLFEPGQADRLVAVKLLPPLRETGRGDDPDPAHSDASQARTYYAQNWTWFGLALYADVLPRP